MCAMRARDGGARTTGAGTKFRLLMWKNFLQQWRHRIQTFCEVILPVATMALVLILRAEIDPASRDVSTYPVIPAGTLNYSLPVIGGMNVTRLSIAYSPESPVLDDVIRSAVTTLITTNLRSLFYVILERLPEIDFPDLPDIPWLPELPEIPDSINGTLIPDLIKRFIRVQAYNSSQSLSSIYSSEEITREVIAAIEFSDDLYGATELTGDLRYSLRFPERPRQNSFYGQGGQSWRTDLVFPYFETPGPRFPFSWEGGNDPGYVNEMFIAIQHVVSMELISHLTGESMRDFRVNIQRFPHPSYMEDFAVEALQFLFPMFIMLSFSYTAVNIVRAVTVEKELQLKETMKIMGLPTWLHWTAWFCKQFIYLLIIACLIIILVKASWFSNGDGFSDYAVFTHTPWTVLLFFLLLYLACTIFFCFMISGFFSKASTAALFSGVIWFLSYVPATLLAMDVEVSAGVQAFTCLSINTAMSFGFQLLLAKESTGGIQWGEFMESPSPDSNRFSFGHVVIMLALDCVLYMLVALYLEQVLPGPYGAPKPWYFFVQKNYWFPNSKVVPVEIENVTTQDIIMEKDPSGHAIGVKITNLTKVYGANIAVNNLSLNIYDDQITVLLGHNGAGKSTTISMLTGNVKVSGGSVWLAGYDVAQQTAAARAHLGFCPQHNVLFNDLTIREHLEFFSRLKGLRGQELTDDIDMLITKLELDEKRDYEASGLSGGQKRRLSVGIALSGAPRVVLLDEPTSGMDPASRRALWDLLQKEKAGRSMILTTHFMDEADILGDRVAIMASGRLQCVGSPYFLKRHYGVGYTLVVVKRHGFQYEACTEIINKYIPGIQIKEDRGTEITYGLTNDQAHLFEAMLTELESNVDNIKFQNYGLTATTLEDVFMSVGSDVAPVHSESDDATTSAGSLISDDLQKPDFDVSSIDQLDKDSATLSGPRLWAQHVLAMWFKLLLVWMRSWMLLLLQVLVPVLQINATLGILQWVMSITETVVPRALTLREGFSETETVLTYNGTASSTSLGALAKAAYEYMFTSANIETMKLTIVENQPLDDYYLDRTSDPAQMGLLRHRMLTGASFAAESATAWFSNFGYHDVATSLAAVHEALLKARSPQANLSVYNYPLGANYRDQSNMQSVVTMLSMQLSAGIGTSLGIVSAVFIMFYIKERVVRANLLQKAAGIQPVIMWGSAALFDWVWFLIICIFIVISCAAFSVIGLSSFTELGRMYLTFMVYGFAMLPFHYLMSHLFKGPALGFVVMFFINVLFGMMGAQIVEALSAPQLDTKHVADVMDAILQFFPLYSLVRSVSALNMVGLTEWSCLQACDYLSAVLPNINECSMDLMCRNNFPSCCVRENPYFDWEEPGIMRYMTCMLISGAVLWALFMFIEYRVYQKIFNRTKAPPPLNRESLDADVADEMVHVERVDRASLAEHSLVAKGLSKYYGKHLAVNQVSFTVSDAEVFGLLGVNGAGKTTTFKMLMGDETVSSGDAFVSGYSVKREITKVHENIGYCPQFDAVFGELTGRETLRLFSLLRGLRSEHATLRADMLAHALGFTKHLDKRVEQYSGGNKRKLSTAVALLGHTRLVFVDEPTTGVDPAAKRQVWRAVRGARRAGRGVVLTSHSMEECEALCSRITIMVNGQFQCLGTPQHLKTKFSEGFTLTIKMKIDEDSTNLSPGERDITAVKKYVQFNFTKPKLMEEYQGLLTYYLPDRSVAWSTMFGTMERCRQDYDVEDYTISQTTLEQIFLQFTKYQKEGVLTAAMEMLTADVMEDTELPGLTFFPLYSLVKAIFALLEQGMIERSCLQQCESLLAVLPNLHQCSVDAMCENNFDACCVSENTNLGTTRYILNMALSGVVLWALFMFIEYRVYRKTQMWLMRWRTLSALTKASLAEHSLVAKGLSKYYGKHLAVNQVSFSVGEGEVFGLLGVNGAGKTTTFKMLMGDETISSGDAFVGGYSVKRDITKVHENIGYCPQFDAVFGELTGRETLRLFSLLRGLRSEHTTLRAEMLAQQLGFTKHLDKRVEQYSGGNKRKLSTAVALLGPTRLVFVDEPTTGVDPAAKRQVWRAVRGARRAGRGVVLTSHSMEECEALCSRITIMVNGQFQCLGTPQHLKNRFSEGFVLTIKMKMDEECTHSTPGERDIAAVKLYVQSNFATPKLMEEYQGLLTYYLPDRSVALSNMFGIMERCRQSYGVEDYTICQTTLEQIFLQFTKFQKAELG